MLQCIIFFRGPEVSDEGKERLMPPQELTCTEDLATSSEEQSGVVSVPVSNKRPLVELSEADSTVMNGFDATEAQNNGALPSKKLCLDSNEGTIDGYPSNSASSTTSSPHEIVSNFLSHEISIYESY